MDAAIDLSDASKALDLANIRFQLMYGPSIPHCLEILDCSRLNRKPFLCNMQLTCMT
jgi:hypothetical protein